jgi:hypothetical protein
VTRDPSYRDRSPIIPVVLEILHKFAQCHDGFTRRRVTASEQRWYKAAVADRLGQLRICKKRAATWLWRYDFCHHAITVRDQDGFATSGEADIFAKLVFEDLQTD